LAWDAEGHRIIAHLAYERLTPKPKSQIAALITHSGEQGTPTCPVASLEDASTWPDCIRPLHGRCGSFAGVGPECDERDDACRDLHNLSAVHAIPP
jgi:hypothetical protein